MARVDVRKGDAAPQAAGQPAAVPPKNIFEAAERGMTGFITRIIERSLEFNVSGRDKFQRTALHWAAEAGQVDAAECLLDYGIDLSAIECNGRTAIHLAARGAHAPMLKLLLSNKTRQEQEVLVNQPDFFGLTPIFLVLQKGEDGHEALALLMESGGRYNQQAPIPTPKAFVDPQQGKFVDPAKQV